MSNTLGRLFRVTTFGESHGRAVGAVVDGCTARMPLSEADIQPQLDRRRPGQNDVSTPRSEKDVVTILSGVEGGLTLGGPIALVVANQDTKPSDYAGLQNVPRPSHADATYQAKYGIRAASGGGRASARETVGRVAAGAVAEAWLRHRFKVEIVAWVDSIGEATMPEKGRLDWSRAEVDLSPVRCPDADAAAAMQKEVQQASEERDSIGGVVMCVCRAVPPGWGDPVFDKLEARLAQAMLSVPAVRGFEIGSGFAAARMRGSQHNDPFVLREGRLGTVTNYSGGIQGGISNGEPIVFRVAFKPPATIGRPQATVDYDGRPIVLEATGRHDPCVVARAVPVVESMAALVLADAALLQQACS